MSARSTSKSILPRACCTRGSWRAPVRRRACGSLVPSTCRAERARLDTEPVLEVARHAPAHFEGVGQAAQVHEVLAGCIARDALEEFRVHERVAMDAHEARGEFLFEHLQ